MISKAFSSPASWLAPMLPLWNQQMMLGGEASLVIARRLSLMALADPRAAAESQLMVTEKLEAAAQVWWDLALAPSRAWWAGRAQPTPHAQARRVVHAYRRKVRANLRRLSA